jgi:hypothetical protein
MEIKGPIVIGGIGGSGTRLVAQILRDLNIFIGNDLNGPLDNLSYTLLFKRKKWFYKNLNNKNRIFRGLKILERSMKELSPEFSIYEYLFLLKATWNMFWAGHNNDKDGKGKWAIERLKNILKGSEVTTVNYNGWGWKEPNSHLILPFLVEYFPNLKYIHVIRNGLDMAYSNNQQQLYNWGPMFGIDLPRQKENISEASFRYWVAANNKILKLRKSSIKENIYILNFDALCCNADHELNKLFTFLEITVEETLFEKIRIIPTLPLTSGKYKNMDLSWMKIEDSKIFETFGFSFNDKI